MHIWLVLDVLTITLWRVFSCGSIPTHKFKGLSELYPIKVTMFIKSGIRMEVIHLVRPLPSLSLHHYQCLGPIPLGLYQSPGDRQISLAYTRRKKKSGTKLWNRPFASPIFSEGHNRPKCTRLNLLSQVVIPFHQKNCITINSLLNTLRAGTSERKVETWNKVS